MWDCEYGEQHHSDEHHPFEIDDALYCIDSLRPLFQAVVDQRDQDAYPPRVGGTRIHSISRFERELKPDFVRRYREAERMFSSGPPLDRIFCPHPSMRLGHQDGDLCNVFIDPRRLIGEAHQWEECPECRREVCTSCERRRTDASEGETCERIEALRAREQEVHGEDRGRAYQLCPNPRGERRLDLAAACNHLTCICGQSFCFVFGRPVEGDDPAHWSNPRAGCPRYNRPGEPNARYDDDDPWDDPENIDAHSFEPLRDEDSEWREDAERIADADIRYRMERRVGLPYDERQNHRIRALLLSARHLLAMMHNGMTFPTEADRHQNVSRRIRFAHHGAEFRLQRNRLQRSLQNDLHLPPGDVQYGRLYANVRRLRFQPRAVPDDLQQRAAEFITFRAIVHDLLRVQYPLGYISPGGQLSQDPTYLRIHSLLKPVGVMLMVIERDAHRRFSLADSFFLRTQNGEITSRSACS